MRRTLLVLLVLAFVLGFAGTALAVPPTVIGPDGSSSFTYQDLQDATAKLSGGYAAFETSFTVGSYWTGSALASGTAGAGNGYATNPHGGYSATTNKCKVCHAVHRAEGAYYLLRADSQADACDYCHIGGSAHSDKIVYDLNPAGTDTTNGHTMGAGQVPDSTVKQTAQDVTITGSDVNGVTVSEVVKVRSYDVQTISLYRFSQHHSQSPASSFKLIGPNSLSCFSCHQPHNATAQVWQPAKFVVNGGTMITGGTMGVNPPDGTGYKLLRRYPSGGYTGSTGVPYDGSILSGGSVPASQAIKVPETTLTAGFNYSTTKSADFKYVENGVTRTAPLWIAQNISGEAGGTGAGEDPATVNQYALSVWCADCHNLNIGSSKDLANEELGFKAHTERTHAAPFVGGGSSGGPGQCYSCHRNDLSVSSGVDDPAGYGMSQLKTTYNRSCQQCHYGTRAYANDRTYRQSDFPHSGSPDDIKLLGAYTASVASTSTAYSPTFSHVVIGENNLDAVCIRCHPGIGVHN